jgi:RNA polymerase sigma-70 factor (ECF subfamily)
VTTSPTSIDWQHCVRAHAHVVVLGLLSNGAPLSEAQELAHEAFARLFEQWATGRLQELDFPGLAMRQALFLLAERRRLSGVARRRVADVDEASGLSSTGASPEERLASQQALELAQVTLASCSTRARSVFTAVLHSPEEPHRSLAEREGISLQRFRQILCEVRAQLRDALKRRSP